MVKRKARKRTARVRKASAKRTVARTRAKPVAFYKQPVVALSNSFDRVFSYFK